MVTPGPAPTRRRAALMLASLAGGLGLAAPLHAADPVIELDWRDLVPPGERLVPPGVQGMLPHDESAAASSQPASSGVRTKWNGQIVRLSGFIVPLEQDAGGIRAFLLVPYVGACIHVPPPPANQIVLVTAPQPYAGNGLFEPVTVTGMFGTAATSTQLAEVGYALSADEITPYRG